MTGEVTLDDRYPAEAFPIGIDWAPRLAGDTIADSAAVLVIGTVTIDAPPPGFQPVSGTTSRVWASGGAPGIVKIMMQVTTGDGRILKDMITFRVLG